MPFTHDTEAALQAAVALVNSAESPDTLETPRGARGPLDDLGVHRVARRRPGHRAGPRTSPARSAARDAHGGTRRRGTAGQPRAARARRDPPGGAHGEWDYHLHATRPDAPWPDRIAVETAMAMIDVVRANEHDRLSVCADPTCEGLVLDLSRNRSRRYCSTTCGNRLAVAAYRVRRSAGAG